MFPDHVKVPRPSLQMGLVKKVAVGKVFKTRLHLYTSGNCTSRLLMKQVFTEEEEVEFVAPREQVQNQF